MKFKASNKDVEILIDDCDVQLVLSHNTKWYIHKHGYPTCRSRITRKMVKLHRVLIDIPKGMATDHINGDKLDNRRINLRICTHRQNHWNQPKSRGEHPSKFKGVTRQRGRGPWEIAVCKDKFWYRVGGYATELEAAFDANLLYLKLFGEYARLNDLGDYTPLAMK